MRLGDLVDIKSIPTPPPKFVLVSTGDGTYITRQLVASDLAPELGVTPPELTLPSSNVLGDILYASDADTLSNLAGNITTTLKCLVQTGTGAVSAAPAWAQLASSNLSDGSDIALLSASNTFTGTTNTFYAGSATTVVIRAGLSQSTTSLQDWRNNANANLATLIPGNYSNARLRLYMTTTGSYTAGNNTDNTFEVYDVTDSQYRFKIRPRRSASAGSLTDIFLDQSYTRVFSNQVENSSGRLDLYFNSLYLFGTTVSFTSSPTLNELSGSVTNAGTQKGSFSVIYRTLLWSGAYADYDYSYLTMVPDTANAKRSAWVYQARRDPINSATVEDLFQVYTNGFVGINIATPTKPAAALEIKIGAYTANVPNATVTQRNRKRDSSQTGNLFECVDNSANNYFAISSLGNVVPGSAALATNATDGFQYLPTCAGTPTGVPTAYTGRVAAVYDTTNNKICVYNGAWKQTAALT